MNFRVVGAIPLCNFHPSFGLTVVESDCPSKLWVQVMMPGSQRVARFTALAPSEWSDLQRVSERPIKTGDEYVHAFIDKAGALYLEAATELRVPFNVALGWAETSSAVKVAISELMQSADLVRQHRNVLVSRAADAFGGHAARTLVDSAARSQLWDLLEGAASSSEALARIRAARPRLLARIEMDGSVQVDISSLDPDDVELTESDIIERLTADFGGQAAGLQMARVDLHGLPHADEPTAVTIIEAIRRSPRQEERLAILIRALLLHPSAATWAMEKYVDPAKMAENTIRFLKHLTREFSTRSDSTREKLLATAIPKIVRDAYPRRRGTILYYFAEHLSDFPHIAESLENILEKSESIEVEFLRGRIESALKRANTVQSF